MKIQIRELTAQDAPQIAELLREIGWFEAFKHEPLDVATQRVRRHIEQCLADNSHSIFVAVSSDDEIVGYGAVHWLPYLFLQGPEGYVSELFVRNPRAGKASVASYSEKSRRRPGPRLRATVLDQLAQPRVLHAAVLCQSRLGRAT